MLHIIRRLPPRAVAALFVLSVAGLAAGLALLLN